MFNLSDVYRWYYNRLGEIASPEFLRALKEGQTLYKGIAGIEPTVNITYNNCARATGSSYNAFIPAWALNPDLYEEISYTPQYAMAGIVNGIIAHNAALHRWLTDFAVPFPNSSLDEHVANLVHDSWIISHNFRWMFFVKLYFDFLYSTPDVSDVVKFIDSWRSEQCREIISQATPEIAEQLKRIPGSTKQERLEIVEKIVELLQQEDQDQQEDEQDSGENQDTDEQGDGQDQPEEQEDSGEEQGSDDHGCNTESPINQVPYEEKLGYFNEYNTTNIAEFARAVIPEKKDLPIDLETRIIKTLEDFEPVEFNGEFTQLGTLLDEKISQRPKKVRPETTGKRLQKRQLHRLATDGKVFGTSKVKRKVLPKQIYFVLDASSSIKGSVGYEPILEAVSGALKGLKMGRNKVYTLAYTTDEESKPVLTLMGTPDSMQKINAYPKIKHHFTPEPYMLNTMRKYIKKNRLPKHEVFMFVLNDGQPCMPHGSDFSLVTMSQQQVKGLHNDGVNVIALALTQDVIDSDSTIYGAEYTVDAQNLKQAILRILSELD